MKQAASIILIMLFFLFCSQMKCPFIKPTALGKTPHDRQAFTQGLLMHDNILYESSGLFGKSRLRSLSPRSGETLAEKRLPKEYFGEGLAVLDDNLYQLTWKSGVVRVYKLPQIDFVKNLSYSYPEEGWGLVAIGKNFVMSDGSDTLYLMTKEFKLAGKIVARCRGRSVKGLNELEYANGKIYANVLNKDYIFEIDYPSGKVLKIIDCADIRRSLHGLKQGEVLNGIAYNPSRDSFYITGKNWPSVFEVKFP